MVETRGREGQPGRSRFKNGKKTKRSRGGFLSLPPKVKRSLQTISLSDREREKKKWHEAPSSGFCLLPRSTKKMSPLSISCQSGPRPSSPARKLNAPNLYFFPPRRRDPIMIAR